jgi:hypothetical protein
MAMIIRTTATTNAIISGKPVIKNPLLYTDFPSNNKFPPAEPLPSGGPAAAVRYYSINICPHLTKRLFELKNCPYDV